MTLMYAYQNRNFTRDIVIYDAAGGVITPNTADLVRAIIQREGETPKLTVTSGTDTANGSRFSKGATNRLRIDASDLDFAPGVYSLIVDFFDNSDQQDWKNVDRQVFVLEAT